MLKRIVKLSRLSWEERKLLFAAYALLWFVRLMLWLLPFNVTRALAERDLAGKNVQGTKRITVERTVWSIRAMSRYVPQATCLTQALAGRILLAAYGYSVCLKIGVAKDAEGHLQAHAWLEDCGRIILGGTQGDYTPLFSWSRA